MASRVSYSADFTAETGQAEENVKRYADQIKAANQALAQAERTAKQSYQEQRTQALATGASTETLNKLTMQYNRSLFAIGSTAKQLGQTLADANRGAVSSENAKAQAVEFTNKELQAQIAIVNELAAANVRESHEAVSGVQATSAAIRGIEGSGGIRAIENFISKTLGLGPAMQAIFPIVGGLMFGKLLLDTGEEVVQLEQKAAHASDTINAMSDDWHSKAQINIDDLNVQADKLQLNIDKLSGHPGNGLQLALDEARKYADQLLTSLQSDNKELTALFKQNSVGVFGSMLSGVASTGSQEKQLLADRVGLTGKLQDINRAYNAALANAKSTDEIKAAGERRDKAFRDATQNTINTYRGEAKRLHDEQVQANNVPIRMDTSGQSVPALVKDNSAKIANLNADAGQLSDLLSIQAAQKRVSDLTEKDEKARQDKENAEIAKRGSSAAVSAAKKAAEEQRKQWDDDFAAFQADGARSNDQLMRFWIDRANIALRGSGNYADAVKKSFEYERKSNEDHEKQVAESLKMRQQFNAADQNRYTGVLDKSDSYDSKGIIDQQTSLKALLDAQRESTYQQALAQVQQQASLGTISKYDGAVQLQNLHTAEYAAQLKELQDQLNAVSGSDNESLAKRNALQKQINDLSSKSAIQSMQDTAAVAGQTWYGALSNANRRWIQDSQDSAKQVGELYSSVMNGVNSNLVDAITGSKTHWKSTFQGIAKQTAGVGLQRAEGTIMGALGLGKADGSRQSPLWVRMADGSLTNTAGKALSGIPGGSVLSTLFGGFRANGGGMDAGKTYVTGERGPELITMGSNGYATSNRNLQSMMSGNGHSFNFNIDASNAHDPAATEAAVNRGIMAAVPHIVAASVKASKDDRMRSPNTRA